MDADTHVRVGKPLYSEISFRQIFARFPLIMLDLECKILHFSEWQKCSLHPPKRFLSIGHSGFFVRVHMGGGCVKIVIKILSG